MKKSHQKGRVGSSGRMGGSGFGTGFAKAKVKSAQAALLHQGLTMKEDFELWMRSKSREETHEMRLRNWLSKWSEDLLKRRVAAAQIKQWMEVNRHLW